ncbi:MAG: phage tail protein [Bryobacteraceae bacterium]
MFTSDDQGRTTARFAGCEALEAQLGGGSSSLPAAGGYLPILYGTSWIEPPIVLAKHDGVLNHYQVLLGLGPIQGPLKVLANRFEIPEFHLGLRAESTGWYRVVSLGDRTGTFDSDLLEPNEKKPTGPYGSTAYIHLALPTSIQASRALPKVEILVDGLLLQRFDTDGTSLGSAFTKNPAWVLLDILQRIGWQKGDLDVSSFARMAAFCDSLIETTTPAGETVSIPRYRCNLALEKQRSVSEILRGIHLATGLYVRYEGDGRLALACEHSIGIQSPTMPEGTNSPAPMSGGWPAYEFGDGTYGFSGIARKSNGESSLRIWSRSAADSPNKASIEFSDEFNQYQRDTLTLGNREDILSIGQEIPVVSKALGIPNFNQAYRALSRHLSKSTHGNVFVEFDTSVKGIGLSPGDLITITYLHNGFDRTPFRIIRIAPGLNGALIHITAQLHSDAWYVESEGMLSLGASGAISSQAGPRPILGSQVSATGESAFEIVEIHSSGLDGTDSTALSVNYLRPTRGSAAALQAPRMSIMPGIFATGGTLAGGQELYYAITGVSESGTETGLSQIVRARLLEGSDANRVVLTELQFQSNIVTFNVYRGLNPYQLLRIASDVAKTTSFEDSGLACQPMMPPDDQFDHANFYWRLEWLPPTQATVYSDHAIGSSSLLMNDGECQGKIVRIVGGRGLGQEREIQANDSHVLTTSSRFLIAPDATSVFSIAEPSWQFGASSTTGTVEFEVPNRPGVTVQIIGRASSTAGMESAAGLSPLGRWTVEGSAGQFLDVAPPPMPYFGLTYSGKGSVDLVGVGFSTLENTRSVTSGELMLHYWNELGNPCPYLVAAQVSESDTFLDCSPALAVSAGTLVQVNGEVMIVTEAQNSGGRLTVQRGAFGTTATAHSLDSRIYPLARQTSIVPFPKNFFGSPASGTFHYSVHLPNSRVVAAGLSVENMRGTSPVRQQAFTASTESGLRIYSGGQYSITVPGYLALQTSAAPPLIIEESRAVRDLYAVVAEAPTGEPVNLLVRQNGLAYGALTIPAGANTSNVISGIDLAPLGSQSILTLDITGVPASGLDTPGRDLTVILRV